MSLTSRTSNANALSMESLNWSDSDFLPRDQNQSNRLHEPNLMISSVDPMTGVEIVDLSGHPYIVDGNMVIYFENDATKQEYQDMPIDHPFHLVDNPDEDGEAEG